MIKSVEMSEFSEVSTVEQNLLFSPVDTVFARLTAGEKNVLRIMLTKQEALTPYAILSEINAGPRIYYTFDKDGEMIEHKDKTDMSWDLLMRSLDSLADAEIIHAKETVKSDRKEVKPELQRKKAVYFIDAEFLTRWQTRRAELFAYCEKFPKKKPSDILGVQMAIYYRLGVR